MNARLAALSVVLLVALPATLFFLSNLGARDGEAPKSVQGPGSMKNEPEKSKGSSEEARLASMPRAFSPPGSPDLNEEARRKLCASPPHLPDPHPVQVEYEATGTPPSSPAREIIPGTYHLARAVTFQAPPERASGATAEPRDGMSLKLNADGTGEIARTFVPAPIADFIRWSVRRGKLKLEHLCRPAFSLEKEYRAGADHLALRMSEHTWWFFEPE